jgi:signal transduction histidine kinase
VVVDDENALVHSALIGRNAHADEGYVNATPARPEAYRSWLVGELVLVGLLGAATAYLGATSSLGGYALPQARLALETTVAVCATIVAILASVRFLVVGRVLDVLLSVGFLTAGLGTFAFEIAPTLGGSQLTPVESWAGIGAQLAAGFLVAVAPFLNRRVGSRPEVLSIAAVATALILVGTVVAVVFAHPGPGIEPGGRHSFPLTLAYAVSALFGVIAVVGFGLRYRAHGRDLDSWLTLALTLTLFSALQNVLSPVLSSRYVLPGDFLRLLSYGVLLVGVWRAISQAEFGRAVADERARVAREIHDGLAQYLFALSTHVSMLDSGASLE